MIVYVKTFPNSHERNQLVNIPHANRPSHTPRIDFRSNPYPTALPNPLPHPNPQPPVYVRGMGWGYVSQ